VASSPSHKRQLRNNLRHYGVEIFAARQEVNRY
jgi:hypothetical protein